MKSISLKLNENILIETESLLELIDKSRNKYINDALEFYNKYQRRRMIEERLIMESKMVAEDSLEVLHEFESLQDEV